MLQKIFSVFKRKNTEQQGLESEPQIENIIGWHSPLSATNLLNTPLRQQHLTTLWQNVSMTPEMFNTLYREPIERYAEMVQLLPASESHHHSHIGGMLDHGLEVISIASRLRQSYILPQNAIPEEQAKQRDVWTAIIIYAALLHDIGKCAVDIEIFLQDGSRWFPWQGIPSSPYNFRYIKGRDYNLHPTMGGFFAHLLIPKSAFDWLAPFPQAFSNLMYFISGHNEKAGILSEIIQKADQISVTMALGGDPNKLSEKPKTSFAKQLMLALREVIQGYKFNYQQGGCDGWLTEDGLWVMSKSTADNIRAVLMRQGIAVPSQNGKLFDELQTHKLIDTTSNGKAIWSCQVTSNEGWTHDKPFSLIKIPAQVIWDNIDQRPSLFAGRVESESLTTSSVSNVLSSETVPVFPFSPIEQYTESADLAFPITTQTEPANQNSQSLTADDSLDYVLNLFPEPNNNRDTEPKEEQQQQLNPIENVPPQSNIPILGKSAEIQKNHLSPSTEQSAQEKLDNPEIDAHKFVEWIKAGVISEDLFINRPNAVIHKVENHLFLVTPSIFRIYLKKVVGRTDPESWELLQKRFQMLGIHRRQYLKDDSQNIWKCYVTGPNRKSELSGFLIKEPRLLIGDKMVLNNQWLTLQGDLK